MASIMAIRAAFEELNKMDAADICDSKIDDNGILIYCFNSPTINEYLHPYAQQNTSTLYVIPRVGDILLNVDVQGLFVKAVEL